jgi:K+-transporting ATPase KdpF subunit
MPAPFSACEAGAMEAFFGIVIAAALFAYLVATLLRPEKF